MRVEALLIPVKVTLSSLAYVSELRVTKGMGGKEAWELFENLNKWFCFPVLLFALCVCLHLLLCRTWARFSEVPSSYEA